MYLKIKDPTRQMAKNNLLISSVLMSGYVLFAGLFLYCYGGNIRLGTAKVLAFIGEAFRGDIVGGLILTIILLGVPVWFVWSIWNYFHKRDRWRDRNFIKALDFQESHLILLSEEPIALAYADTDLEMVVHIRLVHHGKNNYRPAVYQLSFNITSAIGNRPNALTFRLEHLANVDGIFPVLDYKPLFRYFSYRFDVNGSGSDLLEYRDFVEKQIQTHLTYGAHLLLDTGGVVMLIISCLFLLFVGTGYALPIVTAARRTPGLWVVVFFLAIIFGTSLHYLFKPLYQYFKARKVLKRFKRK